MREIKDINEVHTILLNIALELDRICRENDIQYMMVGGTMIGAIRHKGFIPWDDDMDFGVLRKDYENLKHLLESNLKEPYRLRTMDNTKTLAVEFMKIEDGRTLTKERFNEDADEEMGINIDIFPLDYTNHKMGIFSKNNIIYQLIKIQNYKYFDGELGSITKKIIRFVIRILTPFLNRKTIIHLIHKMLSKDGPCLVNNYGVYRLKEVMPKEYFVPAKEYEYAGKRLMGINDYDRYLTHVYGDYMKLPPENKRHFHLANVYYKDESK